MADRAVNRARHDSDGDVTAIGNPIMAWSPRLKRDAIDDIENDVHTYYVPWKVSGRSEIRVVNGPNGKYLRTDRDDTPKNNLDDLDEC